MESKWDVNRSRATFAQWKDNSPEVPGRNPGAPARCHCGSPVTGGPCRSLDASTPPGHRPSDDLPQGEPSLSRCALAVLSRCDLVGVASMHRDPRGPKWGMWLGGPASAAYATASRAG